MSGTRAAHAPPQNGDRGANKEKKKYNEAKKIQVATIREEVARPVDNSLPSRSGTKVFLDQLSPRSRKEVTCLTIGRKKKTK